MLSHAIATRPLGVELDLRADSRTVGDGDVIRIAAGDGSQMEQQLIAQASLVRAGSVSVEARATLRGRPVVAERYVFLEVLRATRDHRLVLPGWFVEEVERHAGIPISDDAAHSLERAAGQELLPSSEMFGALVGMRSGPARRRKKAQQAKRGVAGERPDAQKETEDSALLRFLSNVLPSNPFLARNTRQRGVRGEGGSGGGPGLDEDRQCGDETRKRTAYGATRSEIAQIVRAPGLHHHLYPEWDGLRQRYRTDWCRLRELSPRAPAAMVRRPAAPPALQARMWRAMVGLGRMTGAPAGDELDLDRLVERRVQARLGTLTTDELVYIDRVRRTPEVGLCIAVDASGSTRERIGGGTVLDQEKDLCSAVLDVGADLDLRMSAFAFCSDGPQSVFALRIKGFDDAWDDRARRRLEGVESKGFTRMGTLLRHASSTVPRRSGARRNVFLLLSDGFPYDEGYEAAYAEADTRRALDEARASGLACGCLTFGSDRAVEKLTAIFGSAHHAAASSSRVEAAMAAADLIELTARQYSQPMKPMVAVGPLRHVERMSR